MNTDKRKHSTWTNMRIFTVAVVLIVGGVLFGKTAAIIGMWSTRTGVLIEVIVVIGVVLYLIEWLIAKKGKGVVMLLRPIFSTGSTLVVQHTYVRAIRRKYPALFMWLKHRVDRKTFFGLPLTILVASFLYFLLLLGGIIEDVLTSDLITSVDARVSSLFLLFRDASAIQFFTWVTFLGNWHVIVGFLLAIVSILWITRHRLHIVSLLVAVTGAVSFSTLGKIILQRPRPDAAIYVAHTFSFPSGHATIAMVFYGFITYILVRHVARWKTKVNIVFVGAGIIAFIGLSRLYLGMHYVSDIIGGYLVGAVWLIVGISISEWLWSRKKHMIRQHSSRILVATISFIIIGASFGWYIFSTLHYRPQLARNVITAHTVTSIANPVTVLQDKKQQYTETVTGVKQEPLSIILIAPGDSVLQYLKQAGWMRADTASLSTVLKTARAEIAQQQYKYAPMTPSFWNGRANDFGFEKTVKGKSIRKRHHVRIWKTNYQTTNGSSVYVGVASFDMGIKIDLIHKINPAVDVERDFFFKTIQQTIPGAAFQKVQFVAPMKGKNFYGDPFFTDGKAYIIGLPPYSSKR